jgi:subtilisin family serine protease
MLEKIGAGRRGSSSHGPGVARGFRRVISASVVLVLAVMLQSSVAGAAPGGADDPARAVANQVLVGFEDGSSAEARQRAAEDVGATSRRVVSPGPGPQPAVELLSLSARLSNGAAIDRLEQKAPVAYAEPNWRYTTMATATDPYYTNGSLWGMYGNLGSPSNQFGSQAAEAWAAGLTGSRNVYVGVIDEGIQVTHPDLDANAWSNPFDPVNGVDNDGNGYVDDVNGWDFVSNNNSVYDGGRKGNQDDHGTHVTGTIGAESNASGVVGVNWQVTYISAKFLGRSGGTTANAIKSVDYITDLKVRHGLNIVATNNSWGGGGYSQALYDAIARANSANILFIAAAGNNGTNNDTTARYPANYDLPNVISVAAIDKTGARATWSNYGAATVDLGAPGVGVWSTTAFSNYSSYSGTSMATPHVTGAAALYASTHPGASAAQIRSAILGSTIATPSLTGKTVTGGRLDASVAGTP